MAGKKTKSAKKSGKKTKVVEPFISKYPPVEYDKAKEVPDITIVFRLDQGLNNFSTEVKISITSTLNKIIEKINEKHGNSCHNIKIFMIDNAERKYLENLKFKTFKEIGVKPNEIVNLYYEFEPSVHPLLEAGLV
jgi:hypothetical protein